MFRCAGGSDWAGRQCGTRSGFEDLGGDDLERGFDPLDLGGQRVAREVVGDEGVAIGKILAGATT